MTRVDCAMVVESYIPPRDRRKGTHKYVKHLTSSCCFRGGPIVRVVTKPGGTCPRGVCPGGGIYPGGGTCLGGDCPDTDKIPSVYSTPYSTVNESSCSSLVTTKVTFLIQTIQMSCHLLGAMIIIGLDPIIQLQEQQH